MEDYRKVTEIMPLLYKVYATVVASKLEKNLVRREDSATAIAWTRKDEEVRQLHAW